MQATRSRHASSSGPHQPLENQIHDQEIALATQTPIPAIEVSHQDDESLEPSRTEQRSSDDPLMIQNPSASDIRSNPVPAEQTLSTITSLVDRTRNAMILEDGSLREHLAQIYRELGSNRSQVLNLTKTITANERKWRRRWHTLSRRRNEGVENDDSEESSSIVLSERMESDSINVFFDCISRFSGTSASSTSFRRLRANFSGSPNYVLETSSTFLPEQYSLGYKFNGAVELISVKELESTAMNRSQKSFFMYAESPRLWRRVTVTATIITSCEQSALPKGSQIEFNSARSFWWLPEFRDPLEKLLKSKKLLSTVTSLSLTVVEDTSGNINFDTASTEATEDLEESQTVDDQLALHEIDDMGCPQFLESEVIPLESIHFYRYTVVAESQKCLEYKMPFVGASRPSANRVKDFITSLKEHFLLRGSKSVPEFVGVVLDDSRRHIKSYLLELPFLQSLSWMFIEANGEKKQIPWCLRELWAKHIVGAVADVHSKGFVIGNFTMSNGISVRSNGDVLLRLATSQPPRLENQLGIMPPEARTETQKTSASKFNNFRSDLFYLGQFLWHLAEHRWNTVRYFCTINACKSWPRYSCTANHANPIDLPYCSKPQIPEYFNSIIHHCRQRDPQARLPARKLLQYFDDQSLSHEMTHLLAELVERYKLLERAWIVYCDECGSFMNDQYYFCDICQDGDFGLCPVCISSGVHCYVREHVLKDNTA